VKYFCKCVKSTDTFNEERSGNLLNTDKNDDIVYNTLLSPAKKIWLITFLKKKGKKLALALQYAALQITPLHSREATQLQALQ